ncbi:MAG: lysine N(6)-hydroxylase/L-ornithine N(5)-oxygenase family protein [Leptolyngbya sp. SIO3F4]|nr:lysine N(6)-hydroxylase/L-ornithine N(5)-oxygenase family protein [Leptolyngbya sp. SIO3F4]
MPPKDYSSWFAQQLQTFINRQGRLNTMSQPPYRFVLFGTGFSGGRLLVDLLRRVADARHGPLPETWDIDWLMRRRHFFPLRHIQRHEMDCADYLFGFKLSSVDLMVTHGMNEPHRFVELLYEQGYKLIYLQRQDLMRHAIAILKAQQPKDHSNSRRIDPQLLIATLKRLDDQRIAEATIIAQVPHLTLTYETDLIDPNVHEATAQQLCRFLSLKQRQQPQYCVKLVHQRISDLVANYDEICSSLEQSDYAYVLNESSAKLVI